jgi:hydrogenase maturation protease
LIAPRGLLCDFQSFRCSSVTGAEIVKRYAYRTSTRELAERCCLSEILIIGYGNLLCGDDGVGVHAAHELERYFHGDPEIRVLAAQQLTPEMADDLAACRCALFLDASSSEEPGAIHSARVRPKSDDGPFIHHLSPGSLLASAEKLYGKQPEAICITVGGFSFEPGDGLSPRVQLGLMALIREACTLVSEWQRRSSNG